MLLLQCCYGVFVCLASACPIHLLVPSNIHWMMRQHHHHVFFKSFAHNQKTTTTTVVHCFTAIELSWPSSQTFEIDNSSTHCSSCCWWLSCVNCSIKKTSKQQLSVEQVFLKFTGGKQFPSSECLKKKLMLPQQDCATTQWQQHKLLLLHTNNKFVCCTSIVNTPFFYRGSPSWISMHLQRSLPYTTTTTDDYYYNSFDHHYCHRCYIALLLSVALLYLLLIIHSLWCYTEQQY